MLGLKFFSKSELVEWLTAAGLTQEEIQQKAVENLRNKIACNSETIATNKQIISKAEAAIVDATATLKVANATLKIANKIGG